jgi:hypothetical protein
MGVGHLLHEPAKIATPLGPNDKMPMVGHQTVSAQPHAASSQRFPTIRSNAKKSSSLVKSTLRPTPRLSTWKTIPPGECRLGRDIHGFLSRYPSFVNLVAVTSSPCHLFTPPPIPRRQRMDPALATG